MRFCVERQQCAGSSLIGSFNAWKPPFESKALVLVRTQAAAAFQILFLREIQSKDFYAKSRDEPLLGRNLSSRQREKAIFVFDLIYFPLIILQSEMHFLNVIYF